MTLIAFAHENNLNHPISGGKKMEKSPNNTAISQDDFARYAAPVLLQMAGMARRAKKEFASYLLEMAAAELVEEKTQ